MSESEKRDWGEWERQGVPVLDFLLAGKEFPGIFREEEGEVSRMVERFVESLVELWLEHHPKTEGVFEIKPYSPGTWTGVPDTPSSSIPFYNFSDDTLKLGIGGIETLAQKHALGGEKANFCGAVSLADPEGQTHTCLLTKGHIHPHEGDGWKWFSLGPEANKKPFRGKA
jgi:hypothetical protein